MLEALARRRACSRPSASSKRRRPRLPAERPADDRYSRALERFLALGGGDFEPRARRPAPSSGSTSTSIAGSGGALGRRGGTRRAGGDPPLALRRPPARRADERPRLRRARATRGRSSRRIAARSSSCRTTASCSTAPSSGSRRSSRTHGTFASGPAGGATTTPRVTPSVRPRAPSSSRPGSPQAAHGASRHAANGGAREGRLARGQDGRPGSARDARPRDEGAAGGAPPRAQRAPGEAVRAVGAEPDAASRRPPVGAGARAGRVRSGGAGAFRLGPVDLDLAPGERLSIAGPNGSGKSTLLAMLLGEVALVAGARRVGRSTVVGAIGQDRAAYAGDASLLDELTARTGLSPVAARTLVAKFGLGAESRPALVLVALAGRAHTRPPRGAPGARRQRARPGRADEPPRSRSRRAARSWRSAGTTGRSSSSRTIGASSSACRRPARFGSAAILRSRSWPFRSERHPGRGATSAARSTGSPSRAVQVCPTCRQPKRPHRVCPNCKTYKGRDIEPLRIDAP